MEWDTAAADIIVKEAGGVVLQAGKITGKGELLEDWKVRMCKKFIGTEKAACTGCVAST
jgi:3'-phosphoadenosine 5'-phosphosulfate (PAPS) 3'-phosphatase